MNANFDQLRHITIYYLSSFCGFFGCYAVVSAFSLVILVHILPVLTVKHMHYSELIHKDDHLIVLLRCQDFAAR